MRTYGTARLVKDTWHVDAEPHVAIRLRRHFARAGRQFGTIKLVATDEVSRDLLWFTQRYPLKVEPLEELEARAEAFDRRVEMFDGLIAGRIDPRPFELAIPPREYQRVAAELALQSGGLLVADELGLGKTVTAIAMLSDPQARPALVVTMTHLPKQWAREIERFTPGMRFHILRKGTPYDLSAKPRRRKRPSASQLGLLSEEDTAPAFPDVIITNYHKLAGWADALAGKIRGVVFDEVQELRRADSAKYSAARHIAHEATYRLGLSATPIYNFGIEFFNVMEVLRPGALGSREEFIEEWCRGGDGDPNKVPIMNPRAFGTYVREAGLMIRRTRQDVGRELPALTRSVVTIDADEKALDAVRDDVAELARILLTQGSGWQAKGDAARQFDMKMRQATGIAKAPYVAEFVRMLVEQGEKVVLYGWHRQVYDIWADKLSSCRPVFYTGTESATVKDENVRRFIEGDANVLVISLRSGAGLDGLQGHCRNVVFGELDWSPGVHEQAIGRVHRDGQGDPVMAYFLVSETGADPVMMDVLGLKREQVEGLRDPNAAIVESIATDAVKRLAESYLQQRGLSLPGKVA